MFRIYKRLKIQVKISKITSIQSTSTTTTSSPHLCDLFDLLVSPCESNQRAQTKKESKRERGRS